MTRPLIMLALCGFWASAAAAQTPAESGPGRGPGGPPARLFISPSGEPFRDGDGLAAWFAGADHDADTLLTGPEFEADAERFFAVVDTDGDGVIDGFESQTYERQIAPEITRMGETRPDGAGPGGRPGADGERPRRPMLGFGRGKPEPGVQRQGAARYGLLNEPHPVRGADADLSGRVSKIEWRNAAARRFDLLDLDGDGVLTLDTLPPLPGARPPR
ncbi:hypothetical protein [Phenylobacterium sp.]|uniref:hypothetical protein n=1 Tax=Phenylobacterium sp. TaxID=1871053 RepID=UPI0027300E9C|nr:hypothetical protein [Phenylobacterium sp.]MDP1617255.1 hypothetical protein [Phenylobacterium sp.]MDP1987784.1 hypothetical protein [Phenylobacterium sp.]